MKGLSRGVRSRRVMACALASVSALALFTRAGAAHADPTCISAYEETQTLRKDGRPAAARVQAALCAKDSCPALLTKDCTKWLTELDAIIPTVTLDPRTPSGDLRADVRVKLDGAPLAEKIDGKPMALEPGSHTFLFEAEGAAPATRTLVAREGDKNQTLTVAMAPDAQEHGVERPVPLGVWMFGGASVVALATSAVFAIDGLAKKSDLDACRPRCAPEDVDAMTSSFTLADVALGAGIMAGAAAVYLFLTRPTVEASREAPKAAARLRPQPFAAPLPGGGAAGLSASF